MQLINATPHPINFYDVSDIDTSDPRRAIVRPDATPFVTLMPSGITLNATRREGESRNARFSTGLGDVLIPVRTDTFPAVDPLPRPDAAYIVSLLYATAARAVGIEGELYTVTGAVYASADAKAPCGCVALSPA